MMRAAKARRFLASVALRLPSSSAAAATPGFTGRQMWARAAARREASSYSRGKLYCSNGPPISLSLTPTSFSRLLHHSSHRNISGARMRRVGRAASLVVVYVVITELLGGLVMVAYLYAQGGRAREKLRKFVPGALAPLLIRMGEIVSPTVESAMRFTDGVLSLVIRREIDSVEQLKQLLHKGRATDTSPVVAPAVQLDNEGETEETVTSQLVDELQTLLRSAMLQAQGKDAPAAKEEIAPPEEPLLSLPSVAEDPGSPASCERKGSVQLEETGEEHAETGGKEVRSAAETTAALLREVQSRRSADGNDTAIVEALIAALHEERERVDAARAETARLLLEQERSKLHKEVEEQLQNRRAELEAECNERMAQELQKAQQVYIDIRAQTMEDLRKFVGEAKALQRAFETQTDETAKVLAANEQLHAILRITRAGADAPVHWKKELMELYPCPGSLGALILARARGAAPQLPPAVPWWDLRQSAFLGPRTGIIAHLNATLYRALHSCTGFVPRRFDAATNVLWNVRRIDAAQRFLQQGKLQAAADELSKTRQLTHRLAHPWVTAAESHTMYELAMKALLADAALTGLSPSIGEEEQA